MKKTNKFTRFNEKICQRIRAIKHIKSFIAIVASLCLCVILIVGLNVFGAQKSSTNGGTKGSTELKTLNETQVTEAFNLLEETSTEETEAETDEPETEEQQTIKAEIIPVQNLVISTVDLSGPEESKANDEVVDASQEETVTLPTNEISKLVYGIDVSKWQGNIDWAQVKADGIDFAMIKMGGRSYGSDGKLYVDSHFEDNIQGAIANGIQVGVYFFSQAVTQQEALEEASMTIEYIKKYKITYPVAFDWESASGYRVNDYGLDKDALTGIVSVFCDTVASYGYTPMAYFCKSDWENAVNGATLTEKYKTWYARPFTKYYYTDVTYQYGEALPSFIYPYQMWQYGVSNTVDGINGYVDMNIAFFTYANYTVDKSPVTLTVPNTSITTNVGNPVDYWAGVSATNSIGYDSTQNINFSIIDWDNSDVTGDPSWAINHPGQYKLYYSFTDPTGEKKEVVVALTVRDIPTFAIKNSSINYIYDTVKTQTANYDALVKILKDNIAATSYEGKTLDVQIKDLDKQLKSGIYTVSYYAEDGLGLSKTETVTVTINNNQGQ